MSEQTLKLIELIRQGKSCNEICIALNISSKQLFNNLTNLKNKGYNFKRKYYSDGNILYVPINNDSQIYKCTESTIITDHLEHKLRVMAISDLHFGNNLENLDTLDKAFNYCTKNDINIIFCCGDMIDGSFGRNHKDIVDVHEQIEYFIKNYPFDKNILTFGVAGDHDLSAVQTGFQSIIEALKSYRHDIIINSYYNSIINIKNDKILLSHGKNQISNQYFPLILKGHFHKYGITMNEDKSLVVSVPTLSDMSSCFPTILDITLIFEKGYINFVKIKQIYPGFRDFEFNEVYFDLLNDREVHNNNPVANQEHFRFHKVNSVSNNIAKQNIAENHQDEVPIVSNKIKRLTQTEKFNKRYNK